jgi:hypothetical protein
VALDLDVCGYNSSDRYAGDFDSLTVAEIVEGLRSRELLEMQPPFYYAIKAGHIPTQEARSVASGTAAKYKSLGTHHVFSAWLR